MRIKRIISALSILFISGVTVLAQETIHTPLSGFEYGKQEAPGGDEWQSVRRLSLNKEQPRAYFFSFKDTESALRVLPAEDGNAYYRSLDGMWRFKWVGNPEERPEGFQNDEYRTQDWDEIAVPGNWNVQGIQKDGSLRYGTPIYCNQPYIFWHKVEPGDWKGGVMRTPPNDWVTYKDRNEVGSYKRTFEVPSDWKERRILVNFDGVNSFFYLWINGRYVGFSKNSRNTASFDITEYLHPCGENTISLEVYRSSDGSFLEAQDMWRLPGIYRSVYLTSVPQVHVRDMVVTPELSVDHSVGRLSIRTEVRNLSDKDASGYKVRYTLYSNTLYTQETTPAGVSVEKVLQPVRKGLSGTIETEMALQAPKLWSAEEPNLYTLVGDLVDENGETIQTFSSVAGFRVIEIRDTPAEEDEYGLAGKYFYLNGKTIKFKGVNRHEFDPETGNALSRERIMRELMLMKRANINHIRLSHYSNNPILYYLCDLYGLYLEDEANIESHAYYYGDASLSHVPEFRDAHVARVLEMASAHVNHPSILIWSLGNEAGPGDNFVHAYRALKDFDPSRPAQYERNNDIVDIGSNQYPSIEWTKKAATGTADIKYPFHISEYAHNMGNAGGNLSDYWEAIESSNFLMGGAIWDWIDQALYNYDKETGERYFAYGGEFGDKPNSGMFCMNGIMFADLTPKPVYHEVKHVYQDAGIKPLDLEKGLIEVFNKRYFKDLGDLDLWSTLLKDGEAIQSDRLEMPGVAPRSKTTVQLPYSAKEFTGNPAEYVVRIELRLNADKPWAKAGYVQMSDEVILKEGDQKQRIEKAVAGDGELEMKRQGNRTFLLGKGFEISFDDEKGTIDSYRFGPKILISPGCGPVVDAFRAPTDNDNWAYEEWVENGLHHLIHKTQKREAIKNEDGTYSVRYTVISQAKYHSQITGGVSGRYTITEDTEKPMGDQDFRLISEIEWQVYPSGAVKLKARIRSNNDSASLARLGFSLKLSKEFDRLKYYGRGPHNNYNDRKSGAFLGRYASTVAAQFVRFPKPQSMGNREEIRTASLTNATGEGLLFMPDESMSFSALPWSALSMTGAPHPHLLPESDGTYLHLDLGVTGLGGNSCGQGPPLERDRITALPRYFSCTIIPVSPASKCAE